MTGSPTWRCDRCGYFLTATERLPETPIKVKIICRNCRKHHSINLAEPPKPVPTMRAFRLAAA